MEFTGERYVPQLTDAQISYEHWHRYLYVSSLVAGKSVLDVACGEGYGSYLLALSAKRVIGVDLHDDTIQFASSKYLRQNLSFVTGRAGDLPSEWAGSFDMVVSFETIEHLDESEQQSFLDGVKHLLKPDGSFVVSTPNRLTYSQLPEYTNEFHVKELYIREFRDLLEARFRTVRMLGQKVYPVSYMWDLGGEGSGFQGFEIALSQTGFQPSREPKPFVYAVAVCSDEVVAAPSNSVLVDLSDQLLKERDARALEHIRDRERVIAELEGRTREITGAYTAQLAEKDAALQGYERRIREKEELLHDRSRDMARLRAQIDHWERTGARLRDRLENEERTVRDLTSALEEKTRTIQDLNGAVQKWEEHWVIVQNTRAWRLATSIRRVRAMYHHARRVFHPNLRLIARRLSMRLPIPTHAVILHIDEPVSDSRWSGIITIRGWVLPARGTVARIEASLDNLSPIELTYGTARPDVAESLSQRDAALCGYVGTLTIRDAQPGIHELRVSVRDNKGRLTEQRRRVIIFTPDSSHSAARHGNAPESRSTLNASLSMMKQSKMEIDRASWDGNHLDVMGWAIVPSGSKLPQWARILIKDECIGETRIHLARPDIGARYPTNSRACRSGFRLLQRVPLRLNELSPKETITVECADAERTHMKVKTPLEINAVDSGLDVAEGWVEIENVIAAFEDRTGRFPSVLDWNTDLRLAEALPTHTVFSPPAGSSRLPYLDGSIDVVVTGLRDDVSMTEARRVAGATVVSLGGRDGSEPMVDAPIRESAIGPSVAWSSSRHTQTSAHSTLPSASIIIPVHNNVSYTEACLNRLIETLPRGFSGEIIVVDDASTDETPQILDHWARKDGRIRTLRNPKSLGFLLSCNRGADAATQEVLVFVNNDTLAQRDWLPPLLRILRDHKEVGAVGGKLVYPNGTLQEAGGIIFSDGSGYNYGKSDPDVDAPLYNHVREVDYCSGALLATWRSLWKDIGGFDTRFVPAYYEDTDYCFSVRKQGYRVYYQPESVVVHFEGVSSGTNIESGIKRYQAVNQAKFVEKWTRELTAQPAPPTVIDHAALQRWAVREEQPA